MDFHLQWKAKRLFIIILIFPLIDMAGRRSTTCFGVVHNPGRQHVSIAHLIFSCILDAAITCKGCRMLHQHIKNSLVFILAEALSENLMKSLIHILTCQIWELILSSLWSIDWISEMLEWTIMQLGCSMNISAMRGDCICSKFLLE